MAQLVTKPPVFLSRFCVGPHSGCRNKCTRWSQLEESRGVRGLLAAARQEREPGKFAPPNQSNQRLQPPRHCRADVGLRRRGKSPSKSSDVFLFLDGGQMQMNKRYCSLPVCSTCLRRPKRGKSFETARQAQAKATNRKALPSVPEEETSRDPKTWLRETFPSSALGWQASSWRRSLID